MEWAKMWGNQELCPFLLDGEKEPQFLFCIGVDSIDWREKEAQICEYCGAARTGPICSSCGNPAPGKTIHSLGNAIAKLSGPMPIASSIFYLPVGATIDILHRCRGVRDKYTESDIVIRLLDCNVIGRSLPDLCITAGSEDYVRLYVSLKCEVELYPEGMTNVHP